jgi:ABC-type lipoprotein release transport system permease subunit
MKNDNRPIPTFLQFMSAFMLVGITLGALVTIVARSLS